MIIDDEKHPDDIGAYLLGALPDDEAAAFERHLESCEQCREELAELTVAAEALPRAVEPVEPPARLKRELMRTVRAESSRSARRFRWRRPSFAPALAMSAAAVIAAIAIAAVALSTSGNSARIVSARVTIPGARAELVVPPGRGSGATLRVSGFPQPPRGDIYELWVQRGGKVAPAALFSVTRDGNGAAAVGRSLSGVTAVMVTREVAEGVSSPTRPPIVFART